MAKETYLRTSEVAMMLQVSPKTVARWAKEGRLPYLATLGGHRRFPASHINRLVGSLTKRDYVPSLSQMSGARPRDVVGDRC
jgi:excisionase family DNA binding protein